MTGVRRRTASAVFRNTASNVAARALGIAVGFLLTPFILRHLSASDYGLWILAGSVTGFGSLLDCGMAGALTKYVAEHNYHRDTKLMSEVLTAALIFYSGVAIVAMIVTILIAHLVPTLFQLAPEQKATATTVFLLMGFGVSLSLPAGITAGTLYGLQRFDIAAGLSAATNLLGTAAIAVTLVAGGGLYALIAVNAAIPLLMQVAVVVLIRKIAPELRLAWSGVRWEHILKLIRFSRSTFTLQLAARMGTRTDEMVIAGAMPIGFVTPYALCRRLGEAGQMLTDQFVRVLSPLASQLHSGDDVERLRLVYLTGTRIALAIFLPIAIILVLLPEQLLTVWVGPQHATHSVLVVILTAAILIDTSQWTGVALLEGMARHQRCALLWSLNAVLNIVVSLIVVHYAGLVGVALGTLIPTAIIHLGFVVPHVLRAFEVSFATAFRHIVFPTVIPAGLSAATVIVIREFFHPATLASLALVATAGLAVFGCAYLLVGADVNERHAYRGIAANAFGAINGYLGGKA